MNRCGLVTVTAIAFTLAGAPARGADPPPRFSLLAETLEPTSCLLRADSVTGYLAGEVETGCVLLTVPLLADFAPRHAQVEPGPADEASSEAGADGGGAGSFALGTNWTANVAYHHELLFPTAANRDLRTRRFSLFSADQNRDVLDLRLSWQVSQLSALDFGYQLQSNRASFSDPAGGYSVRRFVTDADLDYALTIGITRRFNTGQ